MRSLVVGWFVCFSSFELDRRFACSQVEADLLYNFKCVIVRYQFVCLFVLFAFIRINFYLS